MHFFQNTYGQFSKSESDIPDTRYSFVSQHFPCSLFLIWLWVKPSCHILFRGVFTGFCSGFWGDCIGSGQSLGTNVITSELWPDVATSLKVVIALTIFCLRFFTSVVGKTKLSIYRHKKYFIIMSKICLLLWRPYNNNFSLVLMILEWVNWALWCWNGRLWEGKEEEQFPQALLPPAVYTFVYCNDLGFQRTYVDNNKDSLKM